MYLTAKPRYGLHNVTVSLRVLEIIYGVIFSHLPTGIMAQERGEDVGASFVHRWRTRFMSSDFEQRRGSPEAS